MDSRASQREITGVGNYILHLAQELKMLNYDVTLIYSEEPKIKLNGIHRAVLSAKSRWDWEQRVLLNYLNLEKPDLYHATWNYGIPWYYRGVSVLTVHDIIPLAWPRYFLGRNIINLPSYLVSLFISLFKAKKILVDSISTERDLSSLMMVPKTKMKTVPLGIESPKKAVNINLIQEKYQLYKPYLIYFGGVDKRKNIDGLIRAYASSSTLESHNLVIVGKFSNYYLFNAKKLGVEGKIKFIGFVSEEDKFALIKGATVLIYPSFYEGFGFPVLEAMSVGTPVITSNTSSLPEAVGNAAITINPRNIRELATAIDKVTFDKKLQESLRRAGYEQVKKFDWDVTVEKTIAVYKDVLRDD